MADASIPITEPIVIQDTFATNIGRMDKIGPDLYRVYFTCRQTMLYDNTAEQVVVARLVVTASALADMVAAAMQPAVAAEPRKQAAGALN